MFMESLLELVDDLVQVVTVGCSESLDDQIFDSILQSPLWHDSLA